VLIGSTGQVGFELAHVLPGLGEVLAYDRSNLDLLDLEGLRKTLRASKADVIVNAAAYTAVDKAESEPDIANRINADAVQVMAEEARSLNALFVHYSTDYVFDGEKASPYSEDDRPNPINAYGRSKLAGEARIIDSGCAHLILRTSWVYGPRGQNFLLSILQKAREGAELRVVSDQVGAPTSAAAIAAATTAAIEKVVAAPSLAGLYHLTASGATTWYDFAKSLLSKTAMEATIQAIRTDEFAARARRPSHSVLDNHKVQERLRIRLGHWESGLDEVLMRLRP
jgi:dTDP-4-dehydrorhamnose reductase